MKKILNDYDVNEDLESDSKRNKPFKSDLLERDRKLNLFFSNYQNPNFEEFNINNYSHIKSSTWNEILKRGIKIKEFYTLMCSDENGFLKESLTEAAFKKYIQGRGFFWDKQGYVKLVTDDEQFKFAQILSRYFGFKYEMNISLHLINTLPTTKKKNTSENICIISIDFSDNENLQPIAEAIYSIFKDSISGVIVGVGMLQIYAISLKSGKSIKKELISIWNNSIYKGLPLK